MSKLPKTYSWLPALGMLVALSFAGTALADGELFAGPLDGEGTRVKCRIANLADADRTVRVELIGPGIHYDSGAIVLTAQSTFQSPVDPGCTDECQPVYCKFSVEGNVHAYRATACISVGSTYPESEMTAACVAAY